jgi:hypothetical protein
MSQRRFCVCGHTVTDHRIHFNGQEKRIGCSVPECYCTRYRWDRKKKSVRK